MNNINISTKLKFQSLYKINKTIRCNSMIALQCRIQSPATKLNPNNCPKNQKQPLKEL